jgi:hypothetical protein
VEYGRLVKLHILPMESSPSKRRKTSPTTSISLDAPATPSRIPTRKDGSKPLSRRPSFASPTKASIARHNPHLLKRPSSSGGGTPRSRGTNLDDARTAGQAHSIIQGQDNIAGGDGAGSLGSTTLENETPEEDRTTPAATPSKARKSLSFGGGLSAKPRRMSRSPAKQTPKVSGPTGVEIGAGGEVEDMINPFKRAGLRRSPLASQEVQVQEAEPDVFQRRGLRRSPPAVEEPPATEQTHLPEAKQPEASPASQMGLQSTASKSPLPRHKAESPFQHAQELMALEATESAKAQHQEQLIMPASNSPKAQVPTPPRGRPHHPEATKLPPTPTQLGTPDPANTTPTGFYDTPSGRARKNRDLGKKFKSSPLKHPPQVPEPAKEPEPQPRVEPLPEEPRPEKPKRRKSARFSIPEDPYAAKKKERDDLLKELQQLQADVALANQENDRLRLHYESHRSAPKAPPNPDELLSLLIRSTAHEPLPELAPVQRSVFKSIGSFLPFSSRRKRVSRALPALDKPIPSHLPIDVDNPLPYLQAFSPLTYTSKITLLPTEPQEPEAPSQEAEQISELHHITASHPSGLFTARLSMVVDSSLLSISSVDIQRLPPSAEKELGVFLKEQSTPEDGLTRDIGLICWAMGRWVEVSVLRARFWCAVEHELGTAEARAQSLQKKKKKRKRRKVVAEDDDEAPLEEEESKKQKWTRRQLLPHMGRTAMELANDNVELRIEWRIKFDWTGEVDNSITASVRLPKSCKFPSVSSGTATNIK